MFLVAIFQSKTFRFLLPPVVGTFLCYFLSFVHRIFFCIFWNHQFFSVLFYPLSIAFQTFFFRLYFPAYFLKFQCYFFSCCLFLFCSYIFQHFYFCFIISACFRRLFICVSSRIFPSWFGFFLRAFLKGSHFFSQTNFAPAQISSFNSVILIVDL